MRMPLLILAVGSALAVSTAARAQLVIDITQDGSDVVATMSGSVDTDALSFVQSAPGATSAIIPRYNEIFFNPSSTTDLTRWSGVSSPNVFGRGAQTNASSSSGDAFLLLYPYIVLASDYVSGSALSGTETYDNTTLAALGATVGVYDFTYGSGATAGYIQLDIGQASQDVPEPASLPLSAAGLAVLAAVARRRKKAVLF